MKIFSLIVVLMFIHCCAAATNRSSVWLVGNTQIFTTSSTTPRSCYISGATDKTTLSASTALFTTSNLAITGAFTLLANGADTSTVYVTTTSNSVLYTVSIQFIYNSTYYITLTLGSIAATTTGANSLTVANILATPSTFTWTTTVSSSTTNSYPLVYGTNTILSPTGSTWLSFQNIPSIYSTTAGSYSSGVIITDYISSSTIAITQWSDFAAARNTDPEYNAFYQLGVRTKTSTISSSSSVLTNAGSCAASGRKRSVDHLLRNKRSVCTSATSIDPSMTSSVLSSACSSVTTIYSATTNAASTATTLSDLPDAFNKLVTAMNGLYQTDYAVFGAGSSKYAIAGNFGMLIALSSIIFSFLN